MNMQPARGNAVAILKYFVLDYVDLHVFEVHPKYLVFVMVLSSTF